MTTSLQRFRDITRAVCMGHYTNLGETELMNEDNIENIKIRVVPHEGFHENINYIITIKFQEDGKWPLIYIDSEIYDKIKTNQYIQDKGNVGQHKGICIKKISYVYNFNNYC